MELVEAVELDWFVDGAAVISALLVSAPMNRDCIGDVVSDTRAAVGLVPALADVAGNAMAGPYVSESEGVRVTWNEALRSGRFREPERVSNISWEFE